ncbi:ATP-binding protein [Hellea balneolensis]|uniref:ATP-binding protein n=1 Tax=Hellea balneolensis TaxID=287478 RepID=UPI00068581DA|nr:ATP-binding protein [Hellea balneolensis]
MTSVIRDVDEDKVPARRSIWLWALTIILGIIILASASFAAINAAALGLPAIILLGGMALVAAFGLMSLIVRKPAGDKFERRQSTRDGVYAQAFYNSPEATALVEGGKVIHANKAYLSLAEKIGAMGVSESAPSVDRLFSAGGKDTSAAVFRLHHMQRDTPFAEEIVDTVDSDGSLHRYRVHVTNLEGRQLWQIADITRDNGGGDSVLVGAPVGLFSVTREGRVLATNSVLDRWLGGTDVVRPDYMREFIEDAEALLESPATTGRVVRTDTRLITRKGVVTPSIMVGTWSHLDSGEEVASVALYGHSSLGAKKDVGSALSSNVALAANDSVAGFSSAPVAILQLEGTDLGQAIVKSANPALERMSGGMSWQDRPFSQIFAKNDADHRFLSLNASDCETDKPFDATLTGEKALPVSVYIVPDPETEASAWAYLVDTSARKSLEDQLVQSQKMQAIGQLAAGVAHDFNNLLTAIRLNTDELLQRHPVGDPSYPELQNINTTGIRAAALVKKLLAFSRKQTRRMELLNVTDTLSEMIVTLKQTLGERAQLNVVHGRGLPAVRADKSQIDTVLMNLCVNARDAMEDQGGGNITISSLQKARQEIDDANLALALKTIPGDNFVVIEVADTGTGMTDDVKSKIFEPFFTTKEVGKGTGLGLATVYGIVQQSGGHLTVDSKLGVGTTFRIYLPSVDPNEVAEVDIPKASSASKKPADLTGQGNILFVEDEASVRLIAAKSLRKKGYIVVEAEDGEEAFEMLEDAEEPFDLMISDVVMPGMDGPTLLKKGRDMLGDARIVFISGYAEEEFSDLLSEEPDVTFLPKPFTLAQLAEKVKAEIGESEA